MTEFDVAHFSDARIEIYEDITPSVRLFRIKPLQRKTLNFSVGSHIKISVLINGKSQVRSYSLIGEPTDGEYKIAVKRRDDSRGGADYMWSLKEGAIVQISVPATSFNIEFDHKDYLLIAGGIGITPIIGMASVLKKLGKNVCLHYAAKSLDDVVFKKELGGILGENLILHLSTAGARLNLLDIFKKQEPGTLCAVCGPYAMQDEARKLWAKAGHTSELLRWETFGSSGMQQSQPFTVTLPRHKVAVSVSRNESLMDALINAGVELLSDCKKGECGLCAMDILTIDGEVDHRDVFLSDTQKHENTKICVCVSRATGTLVLDSDYRPDNV